MFLLVSSASKDGEKETECSGRDEVTQEDAKDKRRRVNVEVSRVLSHLLPIFT